MTETPDTPPEHDFFVTLTIHVKAIDPIYAQAKAARGDLDTKLINSAAELIDFAPRGEHAE